MPTDSSNVLFCFNNWALSSSQFSGGLFLNKISSISKSKIEHKLINELTKNYSLSDLAKSLVSLYKSNLAPIEDIENLDLSPKKRN